MSGNRHPSSLLAGPADELDGGCSLEGAPYTRAVKLSRTLLSAVLLVPLLRVFPAEADPIVRTPANAHYEVTLRAGAKARTWIGHQEVTFENLDGAPLGPRIWLRVWSNGVQGCAAQAISVTNVTGGVAGDLDRNCTALPVDLPGALDLGDVATIGMDLRIVVPRINDRFGRHAGVSLVGTALPTLAVHDDAGWHLDPFIDLGESFYSLAADYDVTFDVPLGIDTPATGSLVSSDPTDGRVTRVFEARDVRDFEWAAGVLRHRSRIDSDGTKVRVWFRPGMKQSTVARMLDVSVTSMQTYDAAFTPYPYPEVDVVLADFVTFGGMEYPQIVFSYPGATVIAHELGHQWWYGVVGDDQYHAPWLDEAFATYASTLVTGHDFCIGKGPARWPSRSTRLTNDMGYWNRHQGDYITVYLQGACALAALDRRFGHELFLSTLRGYVEDHRYGVSTTQDFVAAIEAAAAVHLPGWDVSRFWGHWRIDTGS